MGGDPLVGRLTLEEAKKLQPGSDTVYACFPIDSISGQRMRQVARYRVTNVKTWKTRPDEVKIGVKQGLYGHRYITEEQINEYSTDENFARAEAYK